MLKKLLILAGLAVALQTPVHAQGFPKLPKVKLPTGSASQVPGLPTRGGNTRGGQGDMNAYMQDLMLIAQGVDFAQKDDAAIDREAKAYKEAVDRLASGQYDSIPVQMRRSNEQQAKIHFNQQAANVDGEIEWASLRVSRNGGTNDNMPVIAYNRMLAMDLEMGAAVKLFPANAAYAEGKRKTDAWMQKFGSRSGAADVFEADAIAMAKQVKMPPASKRDPAIERMFRVAWRTSGIDREIMKIHLRGGWGVKLDSVGRKIGDTHDAAIAARNPAKPDQCYLYDFTMLKLTSGGVRRSSHSTKRIACENIPN